MNVKTTKFQVHSAAKKSTNQVECCLRGREEEGGQEMGIKEIVYTRTVQHSKTRLMVAATHLYSQKKSTSRYG